MKIAISSILIGFLFVGLCLGLSYLTAQDWKYEMVDTEVSELFLKLSLWPLIAFPPSLAPDGLSLVTVWVTSAILTSFVAYFALFTLTGIRTRHRKD